MQSADAILQRAGDNLRFSDFRKLLSHFQRHAAQQQSYSFIEMLDNCVDNFTHTLDQLLNGYIICNTCYLQIADTQNLLCTRTDLV